MLRSLYIKNYAIIDELNIEFNKGFNVFTGETGAGKSIIVGALSFLIKGKADTSIIRSGQDKAIIEGVFDIDDYMKDILNEADINYDENILIVRRTISADNHNTIKINQNNVTLNFLSQLFGEHIDIHSQKDSQFLLNKKNHLSLLDRFSNNDDLLNEYSYEYNKYINILNEYNELINNTYNESELEYYRFDLKELQDANLDIEEEDKLIEAEKRYKNAEKYITTLSSAIDLFDGDNGIKERIKLLTKELNIDDDIVKEVKENINNLYYSFDDEISRLQKILASLTDEDLDINFIEDRLYNYSKLKRKHGCDTKGLLEKLDLLTNKIKFFENKDIVIEEKKSALDKQYNKCIAIANKIREYRKQNALKLEKDIINQTEDLMLSNVNFKVKFDETDISTHGIDDVEFYISLNKGENLKPLKDVASGGEISRLMLALKTIFTSLSNSSLVIFDEIDTGVSGKVGLAIGSKMKSISKNTQVLSITHLASVAACADTHFYIYKEDNDEFTTTYIKELKKQERINELANISTSDNSISGLKAAEELFELGQSI